MSDLFLEGTSPKVKVLPVVYFSILDHFLRRNEGQDRVIGTLLGTITGLNVEVTSCFPVPHNETDEQVAVDMDYQRTMYNLHQRVNPKEVIIGWYATGNEITEHSVLIHEFYSSETENPIHLCVDTACSDASSGVNTMCLVSESMGVPDGTIGTLFTPVECEVLTHSPERVALEVLGRGISSSQRTVSLVGDIEHVSEATDALQVKLAQVSTYVKKVLNGEVAGDPKIGRFLLDTVSAVPKVDPAKFEKMFNNTLQDLLMVVYLANLTKTQVVLQEKLNQVL